ncbi:MAG: hypothetical protein AB3A66_03075 [Nodularia sp. CChRGM 3473]
MSLLIYIVTFFCLFSHKIYFKDRSISEYTFTYRQELNLVGLIGRAMSSSYVPREGAAHNQVISELENLYQQFRNEQGFVHMVYRTSVHTGEAI